MAFTFSELMGRCLSRPIPALAPHDAQRLENLAKFYDAVGPQPPAVTPNRVFLGQIAAWVVHPPGHVRALGVLANGMLHKDSGNHQLAEAAKQECDYQLVYAGL